MKTTIHKNIIRSLDDADQLIYIKHGITIQYHYNATGYSSTYYVLEGTTEQFQAAIKEIEGENLSSLRASVARDKLYDLNHDLKIKEDAVQMYDVITHAHDVINQVRDILNGSCDELLLQRKRK